MAGTQSPSKTGSKNPHQLSADVSKNKNTSPVAPSTGGGIPLGKGEKLKSHPVKRDPAQGRTSEGKFDTASSTGRTREYPYHGKYSKGSPQYKKIAEESERKGTTPNFTRRASDRPVPMNLRNTKDAQGNVQRHGEDLYTREGGIKKGDVIMSSDGTRWVAVKDISRDEVQRYITTYYQDARSGQDRVFLFENGLFIKKKGRVSAAESQASQQGNYLNVIANLDKVSPSTRDNMHASAMKARTAVKRLNSIYSQSRGNQSMMKAGFGQAFGGKPSFANAPYRPASTFSYASGAEQARRPQNPAASAAPVKPTAPRTSPSGGSASPVPPKQQATVGGPSYKYGQDFQGSKQGTSDEAMNAYFDQLEKNKK